MVEISKHLFDSTCRDVGCNVLVHPWNESCFLSTYSNFKNSLIGSAKFYFIVHLVQNLVKGKKILKRNELMKAGEYYLKSTLLGCLIPVSLSTMACFFRWLQGGKFNYYTFLMIPSTLSGIFILLEPPKRRGLVINLFCNLVLEFWAQTLERDGYISITKTKKTFLFMVGSAFLFYLMRLEGDKDTRTPILWLFTADKVRRKTDESKNVCPHSGPCKKYILKGALTYFGVGFGFSVAKLLLPRITSPLRALSKLRGRDLNMGLFFASYIGIYRAVICYLCSRHGYDSALYALPAGCLAGLSFLFKPSLGFAIASLTGAFKLYTTILYEKKVLPENIPLPIILYCFCQGLLYHARMMHPDVCPKYVFKLMSSVSNGRVEIMYSNLLESISKAT